MGRPARDWRTGVGRQIKWHLDHQIIEDHIAPVHAGSYECMLPIWKRGTDVKYLLVLNLRQGFGKGLPPSKI